MSAIFWTVSITNDYFNQVIELPFDIQIKIEKFVRELSTTEDPRTLGQSYNCPRDDYVLAIYPGLALEFIYKIENETRIIRLISCERLRILDHPQTETI